MKHLLWGIMFILILSIVNAQETSIKLSITPSGIVKEQVVLSFIPKEDSNNISYIVYEKPYEIKLTSNEREIPYLLYAEPYEILIQKQLKRGVAEKILLAFEVKDSVEQIKKQYVFHTVFFNNIPENSLSIELSLPPGYILSDSDSDVLPKPSNMLTDGKTITLVWNYDIAPEEIPIIVLYERGILEEQSKLPYFIFGIILVLILALILFIYFKTQKETKNIILNTLTADEQAVVKIINKNPGILQKEAVQQLNYSKHKMSKLVARLEEKGIINKVPHFKTNKLYLKIKLKA
jgi:uncharacterized membrane protein